MQCMTVCHCSSQWLTGSPRLIWKVAVKMVSVYIFRAIKKVMQTISCVIVVDGIACFLRLLFPHLGHCQQLQVRLSRLVIRENVIIILFPSSVSLGHSNRQLL